MNSLLLLPYSVKLFSQSMSNGESVCPHLTLMSRDLAGDFKISVTFRQVGWIYMHMRSAD